MNVGWVGLGKLGLPLALAAGRTHDILGCDLHDVRWTLPAYTEGEFLHTSKLRQAPLPDVVKHADLIFVAVQTPHDPEFEGVTRIPLERRDFDYQPLVRAMRDVSFEVALNGTPKTVVVISTVLPGTMDREIRPLLHPSVRLVYNPSFIAMGTAITDYLDPEFILLGGDTDGLVEAFYRSLGITAPAHHTTIANAELTKVAYNTYIGMKVAFANTLMEVCHRSGCQVDDITEALSLGHRRLMSPAYLQGGMGDGGGCHPRDNIALSWLAREHDLSHDLFEDIMVCREDQADWLVSLMCAHDLPKAILGVAYKANSPLTTGSPALLVANLLRERDIEPLLIDPGAGIHATPDGPHVFLIGARHDRHTSYEFPAGSVVIDPWRYIPDQPGVTVIGLGA